MEYDRKIIEGGRCMGGKDAKLHFSKKDRKRIWKNLVGEILNQENDWGHIGFSFLWVFTSGKTLFAKDVLSQ